MRRLALVFLLACTTKSTAPPTPAPAASSVAPSPPPPPAPSTCTTDGDCSTFSSYCGDLPCACIAYLTNGGPPKCNQPNAVKCFVDPCQRKSAACQEGKCVVTAK